MPVAIFSLEMSKEQLVQRLISQTTRIPAQALRSGNVKAEDWPKLVRGVAEVSRAPIWIDDTAGVTLMEIRAKVRRLSSQLNARGETPLSLVVVDYLQLMIGGDARNRQENRQQEIAEISRGLKVLARDLDVPVLAIAQLSRAVESRHDKRPMLSDLRDSGAIEQDADMVMFLYRDEYYNPDSDDKGIAEVIVGKHRNGPTGKVQLAWMEQYTKFASLARRS
jgi:replicative DNA helicase